MKVLLVYPNIKGMNMLPSAIGLFSSLLKKNGHEIELFDSTNYVISGEVFDSDKHKEKLLTVRPFDDTKLREGMKDDDVFESFRKKVEEFKPGLMAFSVSEDLFPIAKRLLDHVQHHKIPTIMGGVFPTFAPDKCLRLDSVQMVCIGEGESALVELCSRMEKGQDYSDINNLWVKKGNNIIKNPMAPPCDMNENPLIDFKIFDETQFYRPMQGRVWRMFPVETHRGCPYKCTYCNSPVQETLYKEETSSRYYRKKSVEKIYEELKHYKEDLGAEAFYIWADTFLSIPEKDIDAFVEMYKEINLPFWCQVFPEMIKESKVKKLMSVGLFRVGSGVEHGNEAFRMTMLKRKVKNKSMVENFKIFNKLDLPFSVNNIMGFPDETRELAMDTIEINRHIDADSANAYSFSPFHGTWLRTYAEEKGYLDPDLIARSVTRPTLLNMPQFTPDQIEGLRRCFILYVKMPKNRYKEIERAEQLTPEGDKIWEDLRNECAEKYMKFDYAVS